jgi:prepilin-type N-terminal cleavage/methylation domain-containing protein
MTNQATRRRRAGRGFTLIEIMIVVGIIVILAGIGLAVGLQVKRSSADQQTKATMKALDGAMGAYLKENKEPGSDWFQALQSYPDSKRVLQSLKLHFSAAAVPDGVLDGYGSMIEYMKSNPPKQPNGFFRSKGSDGTYVYSEGATAQ